MVTGARSSLPSLPKNRVLLVEGRNDKHVVEHLYRKRFQAEPSFDIMDKDGFSPLCDAIIPELKVPGRQVVGIVVDADDRPESRWSAVTDRLRKGCPGLEIGIPAPCGTILGADPRIGVWLWPDNESRGEIENFVATMIPSGDPVWPFSKHYIDSIPVNQRLFSEGKTMRAKVHAWLAARAEPRRMGTAIRAGDLVVSGSPATRFASWLENLFNQA